jgi:hypothetical protein
MTTALTNTGVFAKFQSASAQDDSVRRALMALGHFVALVVAVAAIAFTTVSSILGSDSALSNKPALFGAYALVVYVGIGILKSTFRYTLSGFMFAGGLAAFMAIGHSVYLDAVFFGWIYLGFAAVVAFVVGVVWLDVRLNGRPC